jgi:integrase
MVARPACRTHFLTDIWRPLLTKARLPYRRYHATRHTYATWLLADGADLRWVQRQMGHASIGQTADTYGHVQPAATRWRPPGWTAISREGGPHTPPGATTVRW